MNRKYRKTVIAGNWKMNQLCSGVKPFIEQLREAMPRTKTCEVVLCTPALMIPAMVRAGKDARVAAGGQDVSKYEKGAYTGEISADMLLDAGAKYCIVGHSERREYHHESDSLINEKAKALLAKGITPIICVGESLEQREKDLTMEYIAYQVCAALSASTGPRSAAASSPTSPSGPSVPAKPPRPNRRRRSASLSAVSSASSTAQEAPVLSAFSTAAA